MSTSSIAEINDALKNALATIPGLRVIDYIPDQIAAPAAYIGIDNIEYHQAFGLGDAVHQYLVTVVVGRASDRASERALFEYLDLTGTRSVRAALEQDKTLGGFVQTLVVVRGGNMQPVIFGEVTYISIDFSVTVHP